MGLIDEISIKRIHIEEKIRGHFLSICLRKVNDLTHLVVLIIFETINVLMTVDASFRLFLLFLSGSCQESMLWRTLRQFVVCRFRYFLVDILYLWRLGHVVIDFPCVVASWFRQTFDQIESFYICSYISLNTCSFQGFNFHSFCEMSRSVVAEMSSWLWSIYCCNY